MLEYRFYELRDDDSILRGTVECLLDDDAALEHGRSLLNGHDIEIWQATRKVSRLAWPKPPSTF